MNPHQEKVAEIIKKHYREFSTSYTFDILIGDLADLYEEDIKPDCDCANCDKERAEFRKAFLKRCGVEE